MKLKSENNDCCAKVCLKNPIKFVVNIFHKVNIMSFQYFVFSSFISRSEDRRITSNTLAILNILTS